MKMFTVAGTSLLDGQVTYRFANNLNRAAVLRANGHTDIKLYELPFPMCKESATAWLSTAHEIVIVADTEVDAEDKPRSTDTSYKPFVPFNGGSEYKPDVAAADFIRMWWPKGPSAATAPEVTVETTAEPIDRVQKAIDYAAKRAAIKREQRARAKAQKEMA